MKNICFALMVVFLAGCGATTAEQLRANPAGVYTFKVDADYQAVYKKALSHAQSCAQKVAFGENGRVQGDLFIDHKRSSISISNSKALAVDMLFTIDIASLDSDKTEVKVFYALRRYRPTALLIEDWITKDSSECQRGGKIVLECVCYLRDPSDGHHIP